MLTGSNLEASDDDTCKNLFALLCKDIAANQARLKSRDTLVKRRFQGHPNVTDSICHALD